MNLKTVEDIISANIKFYLTATPEEQSLSKTRLAICIDCRWFDKEKVKCNLCGCDMAKKTLLKSSKCADTGYERW